MRLAGFAFLFSFLLWFMLASALAQPLAPLPASRTTMTPPGATVPPLVVLTEYDPWRMVIGSDSPTFALYDDGLVIYRGEDGNGESGFYSVRLTAREKHNLLEALALEEDFYALENFYETTLWTDQPSNVLMRWDSRLGAQLVSVYGDLRESEEAREAAPAPFLAAYDVLIAYQHPDAQRWLPDKIEVMLWPYETSNAAAWPDEWPGLNDPESVQRDEVVSVYIDSSELTRLREFGERANGFEIDGETYTWSVRYPFPSEGYWKAPAAP
jgi:hypothetical protein